MALAVAFAQAMKKQTRSETPSRGGGTTQTPFFEFSDNPQAPHAHLYHIDPGRVSSTHFHVRDQFQVITGGKGKLGRHNLSCYGIHFARAYTPYGPLVADSAAGLAFFVLRAHPDLGPQRLPDHEHQLKRVADRRPWQISRTATFPALSSTADYQLQALPDVQDQYGLAAHTLKMKPATLTYAPDPGLGDGQYLVAVKGSLLHENRVLQSPALVFVYPEEGPLRVQAGPEGLDAIIVNFPRPQAHLTTAPKSMPSAAGGETWQCTRCALVYAEMAGLPDDGIAPGTRWEDVPDTWTCPDCSAGKSDFQMINRSS